MAKAQRGLILTVVALIICAFPVGAADFYETQLHLGQESYRSGRMSEAIDYFKIANFGLLDRPNLLIEGLSHLVLAQNGAGKSEDMQKTLERFVAIERQYPFWATAALDDELKTEFERIVLENLTSDTVRSVPSLSSIIPTEDERMAAMTPRERRKFWESKTATEPANPRWPLLLAKDYANEGDTRRALRWSQRTLDIDADLVEALAFRVRIYTQRRDYNRAMGELAKLPEQAWFDYPEIHADAFVIYMGIDSDANAERVFNRIPMDLTARPDVAAAIGRFQERESARLEELAISEDVPEVADSPEVADLPDVAPLETGPDEPVDTRINTPRGSFTSPPDPVGEALANAKRLIGENRADDAQYVLRDAIRKDPGSRELRLAMLEASCLAGDWRTGISQLLLLDEFTGGEEKYMFYAAVVYWELDKPEEAKVLMAAALPKLARNPYVDHYATRVLGE